MSETSTTSKRVEDLRSGDSLYGGGVITHVVPVGDEFTAYTWKRHDATTAAQLARNYCTVSVVQRVFTEAQVSDVLDQLEVTTEADSRVNFRHRRQQLGL